MFQFDVERPDLVITDLRGPDGQLVVQRARRARPPLPVVIVSGHLSLDVACPARRAGGEFSAGHLADKAHGCDRSAPTVPRERIRMKTVPVDRAATPTLSIGLDRVLASEEGRNSAGSEPLGRPHFQRLEGRVRDLIWTCNRDMRVTYVSPSIRQLLGYAADEVIGQPADAWLAPEGRRRLAEAVAAQAADGAGHDSELLEQQMLRKDGSSVWVELQLAVVRDIAGRPVEILGVARDITAQRDAAERQHTAERTDWRIIERIPALIFIAGADPPFLQHYVSPQVETLVGVSVAEWMAEPYMFLKLLHPDDRDRVVRETAEARQAGRVGRIDFRLVKRDGSIGWFRSEFVFPPPEAGEPQTLQGVMVDITERRLAGAQMHLQATALEAAANAIIITDRQGVILWVNHAFTTLTGYAASDVIGQTPRLLKSGQHDQAQYEALWATILAGQVWQGEVVNRRRDGVLYTQRETITPVRGADGAITHFIAIQEDVTAQKQAEAELRRQRETLYESEKLAAMGQLLAGVAHELNNPLAVLTGQAYLLRKQVGEGPVAGRADQISRAAERCARIVKNFLALARQYPPERQQVSLKQVVEEAVELLAYPLRVDNVEVAYALAPDLPKIWADPHQLHQVVVNLVTNAHQAMREVSGRERRLTFTTRRVREGWGVRLEVDDTGPGIPPEIRGRIFEPFFTTKPPGQGTGLGLSLCQGIVEGHGGSIGVESEPRAGRPVLGGAAPRRATWHANRATVRRLDAARAQQANPGGGRRSRGGRPAGRDADRRRASGRPRIQRHRGAGEASRAPLRPHPERRPHAQARWARALPRVGGPHPRTRAPIGIRDGRRPQPGHKSADRDQRTPKPQQAVHRDRGASSRAAGMTIKSFGKQRFSTYPPLHLISKSSAPSYCLRQRELEYPAVGG
jgi:PAS domain S-box-containing protein